jgi:hypothetical protein
MLRSGPPIYPPSITEFEVTSQSFDERDVSFRVKDMRKRQQSLTPSAAYENGPTCAQFNLMDPRSAQA